MNALRKILTFLVVAAVGAVFFLGYFNLKENEIGIIVENDSNRCVGLFSREHNAVWQGVDVIRYHVTKIPRTRHSDHEFSITIPALKGLDKPRYQILIPVHVSYRINPEKFMAYNALDDKGDELDIVVRKAIRSVYTNAAASYLEPQYRPDELLRLIEKMTHEMKSQGIKTLEHYGISILSLESTGRPYLPTADTLKEGEGYLAKMTAAQEYGDIHAQNYAVGLKLNEQRHQQSLRHLKEISAVLQEYPDLVKYIYIDKMASSKNSTFTLSENGLPGWLGQKGQTEAEKKKQHSPNGNLDNFKYE